MRVEAGGFPELPPERSRSSARAGAARWRRRREAAETMPAAVQRLFEACREVFAGVGAGIVPPPGGVDRIKSILDSMTAADVGLTQNMRYFRTTRPHGAPPVTYLQLYKCDKFSICIFCLPAGRVIPLHNHPGMTVFSKLLFGSMHIKSYDWADGDAPQDMNVELPGVRLAKMKTDGTLSTPCETSVLYPTHGGNMHCFTARTSCAVLDVLGPPYDDNEGRHCQYYDVSSLSSSVGDSRLVPGEGELGCAWLKEIERPRDHVVVGVPYTGPRILDR